jgi:predicted dehydrogenase
MNSEGASGAAAIGVCVIGAGVRGASLGRRLREAHGPARVVAVAEPREEAREQLLAEHGLPSERGFAGWEDLLAGDVACDAAIVATLDNQHVEPALAVLDRGWHLLLEKPMAHNFEDCRRIERRQRETGLVLSVCHTLRYAEGFRRAKQIVDGGAIGRVVAVEHREAIGNVRFAHNYVRGRWSSEAGNAFLLLHKSCHDIDYLRWLVGRECLRVSSFGALSEFTPQRGPADAPERCSDGCPREGSCPYSALRLYVRGDLGAWPARDVSAVHNGEAHLAAVREGPYGVCVWHAGNDVVDHQVVAMEFEGGVTAAFTMSGFTAENGRRTRVHGTEGELTMDELGRELRISRFDASQPETIFLPASEEYHPEDAEIVGDWVEAIRRCDPEQVSVGAREALRSHAIVFAAERSRREGRTVELSEYRLDDDRG